VGEGRKRVRAAAIRRRRRRVRRQRQRHRGARFRRSWRKRALASERRVAAHQEETRRRGGRRSLKRKLGISSGVVARDSARVARREYRARQAGRRGASRLGAYGSSAQANRSRRRSNSSNIGKANISLDVARGGARRAPSREGGRTKRGGRRIFMAACGLRRAAPCGSQRSARQTMRLRRGAAARLQKRTPWRDACGARIIAQASAVAANVVARLARRANGIDGSGTRRERETAKRALKITGDRDGARARNGASGGENGTRRGAFRGAARRAHRGSRLRMCAAGASATAVAAQGGAGAIRRINRAIAREQRIR